VLRAGGAAPRHALLAVVLATFPLFACATSPAQDPIATLPPLQDEVIRIRAAGYALRVLAAGPATRTDGSTFFYVSYVTERSLEDESLFWEQQAVWEHFRAAARAAGSDEVYVDAVRDPDGSAGGSIGIRAVYARQGESWRTFPTKRLWIPAPRSR
jgi:hypothetical protein